ncbi:MAG: glucokinase, partial [Desulfobacterales bacterium]|nr:glucokinase [Desulfobacterales bacterium]
MNILSSDIGGTNSRFAYFNLDISGNLNLLDIFEIKTSSVDSFPNLIEALRKSSFKLNFKECDIAVFAVAGPIKKKVYCAPPNINWDINLSDAKERFGLRNCLLINDFVAQAYACKTDAVSLSQIIKNGEVDPEGTIAVVGAGTGLGHCALMPIENKRFIAIPSEASHTPFPFIGNEEKEYELFILKKIKNV